MTDLGKKIGKGVEAAPIEVPAITPTKREEPIPGFVPDFTPVPVPVRREQGS